MAEDVDHTDADRDRFDRSNRIYLETSAFNYLLETVGLSKLELTRAYQRQRGVIFVTSPMLLWEIMLNSDRRRADMMLMAAQALFDPVLLCTPTELVTRYLRSAYPLNIVNYPIKSAVSWAERWAHMTRDFSSNMTYDFDALILKSKPIRDISKNLSSVIDGSPHTSEIVNLARTFVTLTFNAMREDLQAWGLDDVSAKFVILYVFLLLFADVDLDSAAARDFWMERNASGTREPLQFFLNYPEIFIRGPILEMAVMAALQYQHGKTNRGAIYDGMHMAYAPYVSAILSNDAAFLRHAEAQPHYKARLYHMSQIRISDVVLDLDKYPNDQNLLHLG